MVNNKKSMGYELNKKERKKLIYLYGEYLTDSKDKFIKEGAWNFVTPATHFFTEEVKNAIWFAPNIFNGTLSIKKAKEILKALKKEEEEDF